MPNASRELRDQLMAVNPDFQRLAEEHTSYEAQLEQLSKDPYQNAETLSQLVQLKKLKLRVKDEMERIVARYAREVQPRELQSR